MHECPRCGELMEHEQSEPDVGITGGWFCTKCDYAELDEEEGADE